MAPGLKQDFTRNTHSYNRGLCELALGSHITFSHHLETTKLPVPVKSRIGPTILNIFVQQFETFKVPISRLKNSTKLISLMQSSRCITPTTDQCLRK